MPANPDYKDLFKIFSEEKVEFLLVGAHAVMFYAEPPYTNDLDVLVRPTRENAEGVYRARAKFGAPLQGLNSDDFCDPELVHQIGIEPNRIDVIMSIKAVTFDEAWAHRSESTYSGIPIHIIGHAALIRNKRAALDLKI